jgi:hypothetical protein
MDQLEPLIPFHSAPAPVAPSPQLIIDAGPAHAYYTVPMSAPREPVMSAPGEPHPLLPNDSPRAFTTVRMPSALRISLTPVPASIARTTPGLSVSRRRANLRSGLHFERHRLST